MKIRSFKSIAVLFAASLMAVSCSDMLTPELTRYSENYANDSVYSAFGILKSLQKVGERTVLLDAARSDLSTSGVYTTDSIKEIAEFNNPKDGSSSLLNVADYYHIINSCNFYFARVDTVFTKNGKQEMTREWAQVQAIRAWTYYQLVRFYGSVPFITTPIENTEQAASQEKNAPRVNKNNLADYLKQNGLLRAYEIQLQSGMPQYGTLNNGATTISSKACFIPCELVLADAYLMQNNYEMAAYYYYQYFYYQSWQDNNSSYQCQASEMKTTTGDVSGYILNNGSWLNCMKYNSGEQLSVIFGASNSNLGVTLSGVTETYGFKTSSVLSSSSGSGSISVSPDEKYQQILPSKNYITLNEDQKFCIWKNDNNVETINYVEGYGDGRLYASAPYVEFVRGEKTQIIDKFSPASLATSYSKAQGFSTIFQIPLYRKSEIYLRFAEAINRLGFHGLAFGVLKDGLIKENIPSVKFVDRNKYLVSYDRGQGIRDTLAVIISTTDSLGVVTRDTLRKVDEDSVSFKLAEQFYSLDSLGQKVYYDRAEVVLPIDTTLTEAESYTGGMYYLTADELLKAKEYKFLNFTDDHFEESSATTRAHHGIHSRGCGDTGGRQDTIFTYARMVAKKVAEDYARKNNLTYLQQKEYEETLYSGDTLKVNDDDAITEAVENLIVDELALETAFEGHRFTDLLRIAGHKSNGKDWLSWKIARRNYNVTDDASQFDATLFGKLQDENNWFFTLNKVK